MERRVRASAMIGAAMAAVLAVGSVLTGCTSGPAKESVEDKNARLAPALLAVPGVTGGEVNIKHASLSLFYSCRLTSDAADQEALTAVLTEVLSTLVSQTQDDYAESSVVCSVSNGTVGVGTQAVGLTDPTSLGELRKRFG